MAKVSAGLVLYKIVDRELRVLLVHLGGPLWAKRDEGAWFIPKGEVEPGEELEHAAAREFREETGFEPRPPLLPLGSVKNKSGKTIHAWAFEGDCDPATLRSSAFTMEWPPKSGKQKEFPEVDRAAFHSVAEAAVKMTAGEFELVKTLQAMCEAAGRVAPS